ncbi:hydrolase [Granulicella sp. dw_53]|uniref:hydrolase n=1 Tax=Granulicella sp. dw_53 TaxID=2719792 RepID=UPI001BD4F416|nr:hydrolase [Granulicella sp. dw_53]
MANLNLDPKTSALVLIDLQHGIVGAQLSPYSGKDVAAQGAKLAAAFRQAGGTVVYVRVELAELLNLPVDAPSRDPNAPPPPPAASQLVPESGYQSEDLLIVKRQWGAFYGTQLDQLLRRRGVRTIVLGGIATNMGVESTARAAFDRGYELVFVEDAMTSISAEAHGFVVQSIFPRMGRVRKVSDVLEALS